MLIARWLPPQGAPATVIEDVVQIVLAYPGDDRVAIVVAERVLTIGEPADVGADLIAELEELGGQVEVVVA